ncbi:hypothetical protein WR164_13730 [Philodulcilactobacillus myokoensis]|uniref:HTH cro/C1-type domain-containing protein n=1 Tax=Philodulcilactobacillus myokoensis TaxID=2929573 RepID=A0A9W6EU64_9LACO|nr:helix-turn-helix transcriptional regulator [Philodulcilactobacillus myokoensis]GLB47394.1 hypothetical protein WR164_13730 [Philodulcilactobacillus myokoensis]
MIKNRLKYYVRSRHINISRMSEELGINRHSLYELFNQNSAFRNETWTKIANYLSLNISDLLYLVGENVTIKTVKRHIRDYNPHDKLSQENFRLNLQNKQFLINVDILFSYKAIVTKGYVFMYYFFRSADSSISDSYINTLFKNNENVKELAHFALNDLNQDPFLNISLSPVIFIKSINGSSFIDTYVKDDSKNISTYLIGYYDDTNKNNNFTEGSSSLFPTFDLSYLQFSSESEKIMKMHKMFFKYLNNNES